jgi:hypothetical protein
MKMLEAEQEALRLCPGTTVMLSYRREHVHYDHLKPPERGMHINCSIWVSSLYSHFQGPNWETAINNLRDRLHLNPPQPCPDQEIQALPAA